MDKKKEKSSLWPLLIGGAIGVIGTLFTKALLDDGDKEKVPVPQPPQRVEQNNNNHNTQTTTFNEEYHENIFCPITFVPMTDPYIIKNCGHSFQREAIEDCLSKKLECPICRKECLKNDLIPNYTLKSVVQDLMKQQK